jgi:hypothetical protein
LDAYKKFQTAVEKNEALKKVGISAPFDPATAVSEVLTLSPSSYPILRKTVDGLSIPSAQKTQLIADMDEAVKSFFVRRVTTETPSGGVRIDGAAIQTILKKFLDVKTDEGKLGQAMASVFNPEQIRRLQGIGKDLEILEYSARAGNILPDLKNSVLDTRQPIGALARVYVGVLNTRARALTAAQRLLGGKAEKVLLRALLDPKVAKDLVSKRVPKPGMLKKLLINFVGSTTGVHFNEAEAEDVLNIAGITGEEIEAERVFMPERPGRGPYPDVRNLQELDAKVKVPSIHIPAYPTILDHIPGADLVTPQSIKSQRPYTVPPPPGLTQATQTGAEKLPVVGIASLRQAEQRKMMGLPFNKGGIVNARPCRQIVL